MYTASAGPVRRRCPPGYLHARPLPLGSPGAYHACTGLSNDARLAREQPSGDLHAAQITLSPPPPPISASLCSQCPVDVVSRRVSIVSRVPGSRGPRVKGFLGQNGLKGTKGPRASGFRGIEGLPMLTGAFKGFGVSNNTKGFRAPNLNEIEIAWVQGSRVPRIKEFHGQNVFKGTKGPRASGFQGIEGFPLLTGAFNETGVSKI